MGTDVKRERSRDTLSHKNSRELGFSLTWTLVGITICANLPSSFPGKRRIVGNLGALLFSPVEPRKIQTRRMLMSRNIMRISLLTIFVAILHMSLVPTVWGQDERICSAAKAAGEWGYAYTETLFPSPTTSFLVAAVGRYTCYKGGNMSVAPTRSIAPG